MRPDIDAGPSDLNWRSLNSSATGIDCPWTAPLETARPVTSVPRASKRKCLNMSVLSGATTAGRNYTGRYDAYDRNVWHVRCDERTDAPNKTLVGLR